jgi:hypothetical protein
MVVGVGVAVDDLRPPNLKLHEHSAGSPAFLRNLPISADQSREKNPREFRFMTNIDTTFNTDPTATSAVAAPQNASTMQPALDPERSNGKSANKADAKLGRGTAAVLGRPLLLIGEDLSAYDALLSAVCAAVEPRDIFEDIWTHDVVHHEWRIRRIRRFTAALINTTRKVALATLLRSLLPYNTIDFMMAEDLAEQFNKGDKAAIKKVDDLLHDAGLTRDVILAEGMAQRIEVVERFDRMAMAAQDYRDATLREIEHHREPFGQKLRRALNDAQDAEFRVIEPPSESKQAA